jgi:hypothetical protein
MRDTMRVENKANFKRQFSGKVVVMGGDFQQILHVIRNGTRGDIFKVIVSSSKIGRTIKILKLTKKYEVDWKYNK